MRWRKLAGRSFHEHAMPAKSASAVSFAKLHPLARGLPPAWASEWGDDRYGPWCSIRVKGVRQRLRWIPPGQFLMGSPPKERWRSEDEGPQRSVRIAEGFWLFDTPCTQALWEAVMVDNPSRFRSPTRPVERVSWQDCQGFVKKLSGLLEGLMLSLPSEAQWEFACRAGMTAITYAGHHTILGASYVRALDPIAWCIGNCYVDFELDEGADISWYPGTQYDGKKGGTHPVSGKAPNGWGLYDMLGNVWEWCRDAYGTDAGKPGGGSQASDPRLTRGGSWRDDIRRVRAASRLAIHPGYRSDDLGFRCGEFRSGEVVPASEPA
jgi:formylglycine-generating enzyme required for sulfatase activity